MSQGMTVTHTSEFESLLAGPRERFDRAAGSLREITSTSEQIVLDQAVTAYALLMDSAEELVALESNDNAVMTAYHGSTQLLEGDLRSALDKLRIQSSRRVKSSIADVALAEAAIRALLPVRALAALGSGLVLSKLSSARRKTSTLEKLITAQDEFIASVSHELRTPATGVLGFAVELEERIQTSVDHEASEMMAIVVNQANRPRTWSRICSWQPGPISAESRSYESRPNSAYLQRLCWEREGFETYPSSTRSKPTPNRTLLMPIRIGYA